MADYAALIRPTTLKAVRPTPGTVIDAQNLYGFASNAVRHDVGHLRDDKFAGAGHAARTTHVWVVRQQAFDSVQDVQHGPPRSGGTFFRDVGSQRHQVLGRLRRPNDVHFVQGLGTRRSRLRPQELTQPLTSWCGTPSPRSSEAMARLTPATCHSFTSR